MSLRILNLDKTQAWLASTPEQWPALNWLELSSRAVEFRLPARGQGTASAVAVRYRFQTGCPSQFAQLGGRFTPLDEGNEIVVRLREPCVDFEEWESLVSPSIQPALRNLAEHMRPSGLLDISWMAIHSVDSTPRAFARVARIMCRLFSAEFVTKPDNEVCQILNSEMSNSAHTTR